MLIGQECAANSLVSNAEERITGTVQKIIRDTYVLFSSSLSMLFGDLIAIID